MAYPPAARRTPPEEANRLSYRFNILIQPEEICRVILWKGRDDLRYALCGAFPATHHMHMDVLNHLPTASTDVDGEPIALLGDRPLLGETFGGDKKLAHEGNVDVVDIIHRCQVLLGDDEHVDRRFGGDVFEDDHVLIFVDNIGGLCFFGDLAKQASHGDIQTPISKTRLDESRNRFPSSAKLNPALRVRAGQFGE